MSAESIQPADEPALPPEAAQPVPEAAPPEATPSTKLRLSLKKRAFSSGLITIVGFGGEQVLRFGANLILTRLLVPEAFGLMMIVNTVMVALILFSDLGIRPAIIQNERDDPGFLNTAWTMQVGRGVVLWVVACAAAYPLAWFYAEPMLTYLLPVTGLVAIADGFSSTRLHTLNRNLLLGRLVALKVGTYLVSAACMIGYALVYPTVWSLVIGSVVGRALSALLSHIVIPGIKNRLHWEWVAARALFNFGRWIFFSTICTFIASHSSRLIMGKVLSDDERGVFSIAFFLAFAGSDAVGQLGMRVLFPLYARLKEQDAATLQAKVFQVRTKLLAVALPPVCMVAAWGPDLLRFFYDQRYAEGEWMIRILAPGALVEVVLATSIPVMLATGDSLRHMLSMLARSICLIVGMIVLGHYHGPPGLLTALIFAPLFAYPVLAYGVDRHGVWQPKLDLLAFSCAVGLTYGLYLIPVGGPLMDLREAVVPAIKSALGR
ncbi:MAG: oligosaccharide flippase family protein [Planctomycetota bacterium]